MDTFYFLFSNSLEEQRGAFLGLVVELVYTHTHTHTEEEEIN